MALFRLERRSCVYSVDTIVLTFFIYSLLGWVCEVVYCSVPKRRFVNRGFLFGPYLPIYGFGATFVIVLLEPYRSSWPLVFILGVLITSALEYVTSFALEKIFKVKLWDYSTYPLNINGRVCALNSTLFGLLCLVLVYVINDPIYGFISSFSSTAIEILSLVVVAIMSADSAVSVSRMSQFKAAMLEIEKTKKDLDERMALIRRSLSADSLVEASARWKAEAEEKRRAFYAKTRHYFVSNPSLTVKTDDYRRSFELMKENFEKVAKARREERAAAKAAKKSAKKGA